MKRFVSGGLIHCHGSSIEIGPCASYRLAKGQVAWSRVNKEKVKRLIGAGRMMAPGLAAVERAKIDGRWDALADVEELSVPDDLSSALRAYPGAEDYFSRFPPSSRRAILEWISGAKSPEPRLRPVENTPTKAAQNIKANQRAATQDPPGADQGNRAPART